MTPDRLDHLFVRYWDDALTDAEAEVFARLLRQDPDAQRQFQLLSLHAVAATESAPVPLTGPLRPGRLSRRQMLGLVGIGGGFAAAFGIGSFWPAAGRRPVGAVLIRTVGRVLVRSELASLGSVILPGDTLAIEGIGSSAVLECQDGSEVVLSGDTVATLDNDAGPRLVVHRGGVAADLAAGGPGGLTLATGEATAVSGGERSRFTLGRFGRQTEVGVVEGLIRLTRPGGLALLDIVGGEVGTVTPNGARKETRPILQKTFSWDPTQPLPAGWEAGRIVQTADGPAIAAMYWTGKHASPAYQVRGYNGWTSGLVAIDRDSVVRLRYRVAVPGEVQLFIVVRPDSTMDGTSMVFDVVRPAEAHHPGVWRTIREKVDGLRVNTGGPFGPPWVGFIVGVNTFERDLGLQVAELKVCPSDEAAPR